MKNIGINFEVSVELNVVGLGFLIGKNDCFAMRASIDTYNISNGRDLLIFSLKDNLKVLNSTGGSAVLIGKHVYSFIVFLHVLRSNPSDPLWDSG